MVFFLNIWEEINPNCWSLRWRRTRTGLLWQVQKQCTGLLSRLKELSSFVTGFGPTHGYGDWAGFSFVRALVLSGLQGTILKIKQTGLKRCNWDYKLIYTGLRSSTASESSGGLKINITDITQTKKRGHSEVQGDSVF